MKIGLQLIQLEVNKIKNYYTEKEYQQLLEHLVVLHDSREKTSQHILNYFDKEKIKHIQRTLKTGDYSFKITACPELGFIRDTYFTDTICIERKNSLSELAKNLTEKDSRFLKELGRMPTIKSCYLIIENDTIMDLFDGKYESKYNKDSFLRTLLTLQKRIPLFIYFCEKDKMGKIIYEICKNCLDNSILK